jgi:HSP20 family protein
MLWCTVYSQYVPLTFLNPWFCELAHTTAAVEMMKGVPTLGTKRIHQHQLKLRSKHMTVVRYEPWSLVNRFQRDIDRLLNSQQTTAADSGAWLPPADINEEDNQFLLHVDLPGVDPKAVEITSEQGVLTIKGKREDSKREVRDGYRRVERITGEFQRRFSLPDTADVQNIKAKAVNGVLEVSIPKLAQVQPQRITVEAA